jgi:hypothetical protein
VEGAAGTGKTLLGLEFIYRGITEYHEPGIIVTFEVAPRKLVRVALAFGWDLEALQQQNQLKLIFTSPQVLSQELRSRDSPPPVPGSRSSAPDHWTSSSAASSTARSRWWRAFRVPARQCWARSCYWRGRRTTGPG